MTAAARPTANARFLDQVEDSTQITHGAKVQVWGGPETGKSHDAYENLPRPLIVVDSDVSAGLFNDDRFEGFKRLGPDKIPDLETLVAFLDEFTSDPRWYRTYKSLLIDSLTQFVDPKVASLGIDMTSATEKQDGRAQADWARIAKELTRLVRKVSALGVNIYVVAEERTRFVGNRPGEGDEGAKSSLSPKKFTHAFDLILQKTTRGDVIVRKTRYRKWSKDQKRAGYAAPRDPAPSLPVTEPPRHGAEGRGTRGFRPRHHGARGAHGPPQDPRLRRARWEDPARQDARVPRRREEQRRGRARGAEGDQRGEADVRRGRGVTGSAAP